MVVARHSHGQLVVLDKLREMVRLAAGLEPDGRLKKEVADRALRCLERFGQRLRDMRASSVRVVGTSALRLARRADPFLNRARAALGHPIEIISGIEEARLIYAGVAHTMAPAPERRLVCDIGGGSTEIIIGEGLNPLALESLTIGCVRLNEQFFADGRLSQKRIARARLAARLAIEPYQAAFRRRGWDEAVGSAGTVRAIGDAVRELLPASTAITVDGLELILAELAALEHIRDLPLKTVDVERRKSFAGGVAILAEIFDQLGIEEMRVAEGAMREGLLYDLLGRYTDEDARDRSVRGTQRRYHVDLEQADRVENTALGFLSQVEESWDISDPDSEQILRWAARLHEIGLDVAHSGYHRHGAYLLEHADMAGFTREEQRLLARIVALHRRKTNTDQLAELRVPWDTRVPFLAVLLRLAVLLHRGRSPTRLPDIVATPRKRAVVVAFPAGWLDDNPLTDADLRNEALLLKGLGFRLLVESQKTVG